MTQNHRKIYRKENSFYSKINAGHLDAANQHRQFQTKKKHEKDSGCGQIGVTSHAKLRFDFNKPNHYFLFSVLAFSAIQTVASSEVQKIDQQVRRKTINAGKVSNASCEKLQNEIIETIGMKGFDNDYMKYVLDQENFHILCKDDGHPIVDSQIATFILSSQDMKFHYPDVTDKKTIRHEFYHAYNFFYHKNGKCQGSNMAMLSPVYPTDAAEIQQYNEAFDQGDERIGHFINLINKAEKDDLSEADKKIYDKYSEAFGECIPELFRRKINLNERAELRHYTKDDLIDKYTKMQGSNGYKAQEVKINMDELVIIFVHTTIKASVEYFQRNLIHYHKEYKNRYKTDLLIISEREAYTFQSLSRQAQEIFYPEALELQKIYRARCAHENNPEPDNIPEAFHF